MLAMREWRKRKRKRKKKKQKKFLIDGQLCGDARSSIKFTACRAKLPVFSLSTCQLNSKQTHSRKAPFVAANGANKTGHLSPSSYFPLNITIAATTNIRIFKQGFPNVVSSQGRHLKSLGRKEQVQLSGLRTSILLCWQRKALNDEKESS